MASTDRPSGLTALAVINLILAFLQALGVLSFLITRYVSAPAAVEHEHVSEAQRGMLSDLAQVPLGSVVVITGLMAISGLLLLATAIGYLRRSRFWGRHLTTVYVICDLSFVGCLLVLMPESYIRSLGIGLIRTAFYPIFLGAVIHTVFRRDLVR